MPFILAIFLFAAQVRAAERPSDAAPAESPARYGWLEGYDSLRQALVADQVDASKQAAEALAAQAVSDPELAAAAWRVEGAADLPARRTAFGDLSRLVVLRLAADPSAPRVYAYQCTMASGYGYWVQMQAGLSNPYMGQAMPACGFQVSFRAAVRAAGG